MPFSLQRGSTACRGSIKLAQANMLQTHQLLESVFVLAQKGACELALHSV